MNSARSVVLVLLGLALATLPLAGCRSTRARAAGAGQSVAMQPAPSTVPPQIVYSGPTPPASSTPSAPPSAWSPPSAPPPPTGWPAPSAADPMNGGPMAQAPTPDGSADVPMNVPSPANSADLGTPAVASAIAADREARVRVDQELAALHTRLQKAQASLSAPPSAPAVAAAPGATRGGSAQAAQFAQAIRSKGSRDVEVRGNEVVIRFTDAFQPGSEKLKKDAGLQTAILATASELSRYPGAVVEVVGHSDGQPIKVTKNRWRDNVQLSRERAQTVANELAKNGIPASRLAVNGRGSVEPLVFPEKTATDRAKNRRVEIRVRF